MKLPWLLVPAVLALAACQSGPSATPAQQQDGGPVTITFANADPAATWQPVIDHCRREIPGLTVKQLNIPYPQLTSTITQRLSQGNADLDVFNVVPAWIQDYTNRGFLADLSELKSKAVANAVSADMVTANEVGGKLFAISPWTTSQFLYYNADVLRNAGITPPSADPAERWTWQQLRAAAAQLKGKVQYPLMFDQFDSYYQLQPLGVSAGGGNGLTGDKPDFTNAGWQSALGFYQGLFKDGLSPRGITNDKTNAIFSSGKAGFIVSGPWTVSNAVKGKLPFGVAAAPVFEGGKPATSTDSWAMAVSQKSPRQAAARKFVECVTLTEAGATASIKVAQITPTQKAAYQTFAKQLEGAGGTATSGLAGLMESELRTTAVHRPSVTGYTVFEAEAEKLFADVRNGAEPAARAKQADATIAEQLKRLG
ncbi:extracellular solute-binding protein [Kribbella sp. NBC_01505]|uniref:sugar ABC transporter substrate-binding protein n=1 Tax=Kribbella sp. NBC_01505 TaxID=2903580 RepID=UPI00386EAECA